MLRKILFGISLKNFFLCSINSIGTIWIERFIQAIATWIILLIVIILIFAYDDFCDSTFLIWRFLNWWSLVLPWIWRDIRRSAFITVIWFDDTFIIGSFRLRLVGIIEIAYICNLLFVTIINEILISYRIICLSNGIIILTCAVDISYIIRISIYSFNFFLNGLKNTIFVPRSLLTSDDLSSIKK
jgi:hypothetical protein